MQYRDNKDKTVLRLSHIIYYAKKLCAHTCYNYNSYRIPNRTFRTNFMGYILPTSGNVIKVY